MIFILADRDRGRLDNLTRLLFSLFPGSMVYQHTSLTRASHDVLHHHVDALFVACELEREDGSRLMQMLPKQCPELPVFILSDTEKIEYRQSPHSIAGRKLREILLTSKVVDCGWRC